MASLGGVSKAWYKSRSRRLSESLNECMWFSRCPVAIPHERPFRPPNWWRDMNGESMGSIMEYSHRARSRYIEFDIAMGRHLSGSVQHPFPLWMGRVDDIDTADGTMPSLYISVTYECIKEKGCLVSDRGYRGGCHLGLVPFVALLLITLEAVLCWEVGGSPLSWTGALLKRILYHRVGWLVVCAGFPGWAMVG